MPSAHARRGPPGAGGCRGARRASARPRRSRRRALGRVGARPGRVRAIVDWCSICRCSSTASVATCRAARVTAGQPTDTPISLRAARAKVLVKARTGPSTASMRGDREPTTDRHFDAGSTAAAFPEVRDWPRTAGCRLAAACPRMVAASFAVVTGDRVDEFRQSRSCRRMGRWVTREDLDHVPPARRTGMLPLRHSRGLFLRPPGMIVRIGASVQLGLRFLIDAQTTLSRAIPIHRTTSGSSHPSRDGWIT